ncbi:MAG: carboxypeptidase regulatory-like domain-containing protein [Candidatus Krumholzibacteria bacterium]|nr:carboxypeptidase regulatory-like domain-containing protein [Candidatus Krumholzibacteria bacterium]MDH4337029.1 carboxypeptidase regulatory-like domain-containing protein [Candidatus Krumholzibacteria bacterium]MDH5268566.1 carboxypeptidase regulatory-like domain-containing protein [Candidatus Krumholzibacteria bacterium]
MRIVLAAALAALLCTSSVSAGSLSGSVTRDGKPLAGAFVTARDSSAGLAVSVRSDSDGRYQLEVPAGSYTLTARVRGAVSAAVAVAPGAGADLDVNTAVDAITDAPPRAFISILPDGDEKRRFIVDCMGCHSMRATNVLDVDGTPRDESAWAEAVDQMLAFAGHDTGFPILPPDRTAGPTAAYLARHVTAGAIERAVAGTPPLPAPGTAYEVTEWDLPEQRDFPHDLMRDGRGNVLVTGMFSGSMYLLDPKSGDFSTVAIPVPGANPRALDIDDDGDWWILLGFPRKLARYRVDAKEWDTFDIGVYGHSVGVDAKKRAWFNGHFTRDPIVFGYVDAASGETRTLEAPPTPMPVEQGGPIPYELRVGPDNTIWITELAGNRLIRHVPESGATTAFELPVKNSGPRRCDVGPDGRVWIPEYAGGKLACFDPATERFEEFDLPVRDSLPYCARVDAGRGLVWVSQCAADAIARFDIRSGTWTEFELPTRNAFIRHMDIDPDTGEVWAAYSHSPNLEMRVVRLRAAR